MNEPMFKLLEGKPDLADVEAYLQAALRPVLPRPEFVGNLRSRLMTHAPQPKAAIGAVQYVLLGTAGVLSSILLLVTGIRATVTLIGAIRIFRQVKQEMVQKQAASLNPANPAA